MDAGRLRAMMQNGDWEAAFDYCNESIRDDAKSASAWLNRGVVLYEFVRLNCRLFTNEHFVWLVALFDKSGKMASAARSRVKGLLGSSHALRLEKLMDEAERSLDMAVKLDPHSSNAHLWRGMVLRDTGRLDAAEVDLRRAVDLAAAGSRGVAQEHLGSVSDFDWPKAAQLLTSGEFCYNAGIPKTFGQTASHFVATISRRSDG